MVGVAESTVVGEEVADIVAVAVLEAGVAAAEEEVADIADLCALGFGQLEQSKSLSEACKESG